MRYVLLQKYYDSPEYLTKLRAKMTVLKKMEEDEFYRAEMLLDRYSVDPVAFIEDFCMIMVKEFNSQPKPQFLFPYQKRIIAKLQESEMSNLDIDLLVDKPRGMGLTWLLCSYYLWRFLFTPNYSAFILSRTESEVDDGTDSPDNCIFGKIRWQMKYLPIWLIPQGFKRKQGRGTTTDSTLKLLNPQIGSSIIGSSTNSNAGRSRRYSAILIDECFYIEHFQEVYRSLNSVARLKVFISTTVESKVAKDFKDMCQEQGHYVPLTWKDHPFKDQQWYDDLVKKAEQLDDPDLMREAEINYTVSPKSQYYPVIAQAKLMPAIYDPNRPLYISLDIGGRQDLTVIGWWQFDGLNFKLIFAYENNNKPIEWYAPFLNSEVGYDPTFYNQYQVKALEKVRTMKKAIAWFGEQAHLAKVMPTNKSNADMLLPFSIRIIANQYAIQHPPRHAATSQLLPKIIFNTDEDSVMKVYDSVANAKYASMDRTTTENLKPIHGTDGSADRRAMLENFCVNVGRLLRKQRDDVTDPNVRSFSAAIIKQLRV